MGFGVDLSLGAGLGIIATLICALVAERYGFLQINLMRQTHALNAAKTAPRIGCEVLSVTEQILPPAYSPHTRIVVKLYNEGELAVENVKGYWKYIPDHALNECVFPISRDFLGHCEKQIESHLIEDSVNWRREGISFKVEVDFFYTLVEEQTVQQYKAEYHYDPQSKRMVKRDYV